MLPAPRDSRAQHGFTLLEILIVVFLIGLMSAVLMPKIGFRSTSGLRSSSRVLAAEIRYAAERAIASGETHRFVVDLASQIFRLERVVVERPERRRRELPSTPALLDLRPPQTSREFLPVPSRAGEWRALDDPEVRIEGVVIGDQTYEDDRAAITFDGDGGADPAEVRLIDDFGARSVLVVSPFTGEVRISELLDGPGA